MNWLQQFTHLPMLWDVIIPTVALITFALFLAWESRLPPEKKIFRRLRGIKPQKQQPAPVKPDVKFNH